MGRRGGDERGEARRGSVSTTGNGACAMCAASLASASRIGQGASARRAEGRASNSTSGQGASARSATGRACTCASVKEPIAGNAAGRECASTIGEGASARSFSRICEHRRKTTTIQYSWLSFSTIPTVIAPTSLHRYRNTLHTFGDINHLHARNEGSAQPAPSR